MQKHTAQFDSRYVRVKGRKIDFGRLYQGISRHKKTYDIPSSASSSDAGSGAWADFLPALAGFLAPGLGTELKPSTFTQPVSVPAGVAPGCSRSCSGLETISLLSGDF